ncbi:MAG: ATP-binding protein [Candidatus Omnitrophica bacterium]|nr:ATP-binding protein [Candidatus Omnitrophota bacterium]
MEKISFPAKLENLEAMIDFIIAFAQNKKFPDDKLNQIRLACEEVLVNVINYAYPGSPGEVEIVCSEAGGKGVIIEVMDSGIPFNPLEKEPPDISQPIERRKIGGLGIFLAKKVMDELSYERKENKNSLRLVKYA